MSSGLDPTLPDVLGATAPTGLAETAAPDAAATGGERSPFEPRSSPFVRRSVLGRGGMGQVVLAHDQRLGRTVAVKELLSQTEAGRARFEREVRLAARLQHPNIVPVYEAGTTERGEPYYAMRPVEGRTLGQVIDQARTAGDRLALVPRVIAVAEALAFAHRSGVIHRDLKPSNVLVGEHGETVVIDWGLAKELGDDADPVHASAPSLGSADLTRLGSVIGTPSYMPPEQARGDALDARADVYAIGGILYHVLAGVPPYHGARSADELLDQVKAGPPLPLATLAPGMPPDLIAVVERAMTRDPAGRYADARGLADDLTRFATGRLVSAHAYSARQLIRRWLRRHRIAVAVSAVALAVLAAVGVYSVIAIRDERTTAVDQRGLAIEHQRDAEALVDYMLGDLQTRLARSGDLGALTGSIDRITAYLARNPPAPGDVVGIRRQVELQLQVAVIEQATGHLARANATITAAIGLAETAGGVDDRELRPLIHGGLADLAVFQLDGGTPGPAAATIERALAISRPAAADGDPTWQRFLANDLFVRARARAASADPVGERTDVEAARAALAALAAVAPDDREVQRDLARAVSRLAQIAGEAREPERALALATEAATLFERLAAAEPDQVYERGDLVLALLRLGRYQAGADDRLRARTTYDRARALTERLLIDDPARPRHAATLAQVLTELAALDRAELEFASALALEHRALELLVHLGEVEPANLKWRMNVAELHDQIAATLRESGDLRAALAEYEPAFRIRRELIAASPTAIEHVLDLARDLDKTAQLHRDLGDHRAAARASLDAIALREPVIAAHPDHREAVLLTGVSCMRAGNALAATADPPGAIAVLERGAALIDGYLARTGKPDPDLAELRQVLADLRVECCGRSR